MKKSILIATDGSPLSAKAIAIAVDMARKLGTKLVACTAVPPYPYYGLGDADGDAESRYLARAGVAALERLAHIERAAQAAGVEFVSIIKEQAPPHRAILQTAQEQDSELIVLASRGRSELESLVLGSETQKLLAVADRAVLVVR